jgi:predicted CoA-substrate-specific enzyme activase
MFKLGLDIGSTTIKAVVIDEKNNLVTTDYQRHNAKISESIELILNHISAYLDNTIEISIGITGSIGMGIAKRGSFPFVQEVVAVTHAIKMMNLQVTTMIDIGGEDTKVVFFNECGETTDMRMNGNCAGGTGAFIDQMAIILDEEIDNLNRAALQAQKTHPIASRCGVFSKTDVQNLIAKGVARNEVAASIFHAVAVQTITTLAHGCEIKPPLLFCGGTLTLNSALQKAFLNYLDISESDAIILPEGNLLPAIGAAIAHSEYYMSLNDLKTRLKSLSEKTTFSTKLSPLFSDKDNYRTWLQKFKLESIANVTLPKGY